MKIKRNPLEHKLDKNEENFIQGKSSNDDDIILISLRLKRKYVKKIDRLIEDDQFLSRNEWIARNIIKILDKVS